MGIWRVLKRVLGGGAEEAEAARGGPPRISFPRTTPPRLSTPANGVPAGPRVVTAETVALGSSSAEFPVPRSSEEFPSYPSARLLHEVASDGGVGGGTTRVFASDDDPETIAGYFRDTLGDPGSQERAGETRWEIRTERRDSIRGREMRVLPAPAWESRVRYADAQVAADTKSIIIQSTFMFVRKSDDPRGDADESATTNWVRCPNQHFYDGSRYTTCPYCAASAGNAG